MSLKIKISIIYLFLVVFAQAQKNTTTLKLAILSSISVGWGDIYSAHVEKVTGGNVNDFTDTIRFGITAKNPYKYYKIRDTLTVQFQNSGKKNDQLYLPPIDGTVSKNRTIWLITKVEEKLKK